MLFLHSCYIPRNMLQPGMFVIANSAEKAVSGLDAQALPITIRKAILLYPVTDVGGQADGRIYSMHFNHISNACFANSGDVYADENGKACHFWNVMLFGLPGFYPPPNLAKCFTQKCGICYFSDETSFVFYADARAFRRCLRRMRQMDFHESWKNRECLKWGDVWLLPRRC